MTRQRETEHGEKTDRKRERERETKKDNKKKNIYIYMKERKKEAERERERVRARASDLDSELKCRRRRMAEPRFHVCVPQFISHGFLDSSVLMSFAPMHLGHCCTRETSAKQSHG